MQKQLDQVGWLKREARERPRVNQMLALLQRYGAWLEWEMTQSSGVLSYLAIFQFPGRVQITTRLAFLDWRCASDVVIIKIITTLPNVERKTWPWRLTVLLLQIWAYELGLVQLRVIQASKNEEHFWIENGFIKDEAITDYTDFIFSVPRVKED
jgi:hypothetical protein